VFQLDIRKRAAEDIFRKHKPDAVIHMATVTHLTVRSDDRYRINLFGTRAVFDHCHITAPRAVCSSGGTPITERRPIRRSTTAKRIRRWR